MENNQRTAQKSFEKVQGKDKKMETKKLNPVFDDLNNPAVISSHIEQLKGNSDKATPHAEILQQLIKQFEPLDFEILAFPQSAEIKNERYQLQIALFGKLGEVEPIYTDNQSNEYKEAFKNWQELGKELSKFKLNTKHFLILSIENALKFAEKNHWGLCKNHDFIYLYNGTFWAEIDKETFQKFLGEASEQMGVAIFSAKFYQFREQLSKQFIATAYLPTPESNKDTVLINLQNGTFEISPQSRKLRPFDRSDFITYQLPFKYDPQAKAPLFEAYLNKVLPDLERQRVLAEYLGFVFIKHGSNALKEEKALILYGTGANGKSVFFEIATAMFGRENVSNYSLQSLTEEKGFYRAKISNKLVNYASEISGKLEASLFKAMVSGEPVEACLKYGQPFTMTDYAKFIFNCNELPKDVEHTNAYFRRFLIIPFDVTIPEHEQDKSLHTKIIEKELSGVFNWVLNGLKRLLEQKRFSDCEASQQAVEQYKIESNSVQMFLNENDYKGSTTNSKLIKTLYLEYRAFCNEDGMTPFKKSNFIKQLKAFNFIVDRVSQNQLAVFIEN